MAGVLISGSTAGGAITGTGARILVGVVPVVLVGDSVESHGDSPHSSAKMAEGSARVAIGLVPVCFEGDKATCNHAGAAGSPRITEGA